jgi:diguanylate cyclase (GGDEF)-like protein
MRLLPYLERPTRTPDSIPFKWIICMLTTAAGVVAFSLVVAYYLFENNLAQQRDQLQLIGSKTLSTLENEINVRNITLKAIRNNAEQYLAGKSRVTLDPTRYLHRLKKNNAYTMEIPPGYDATSIGNITGAGPIPARNSVAAREMAMSIGLMPLFQTLINRDKATAWVYYTSKNRFTHIFPRVSVSEFCYTDKSLDFDVYKMALPQNNPLHKIFWTPPYQDEAGKGMMVTVAAPVYEGKQFRGTVAIDVTLSALASLLKQYETPASHIYLYTKDGVFLAGTHNDLGFRPGNIEPDNFIKTRDKLITDFDFKKVPWRILVATSRADMHKKAFWYALPFALVVAFLCLSVLLLFALIGTLRKAQECSIRDGLTGIYNRRHFDTIAGRELASAHRDKQYFAMIILDIDYFKLYNDTYGHQAGDKILKSVCKVLEATLKRPVDYIFRVGGEEFAILTRTQRPEQVEKFAQVLLDAIADAQLDFPESPQNKITASLGVAILSPDSSMSIDKLFAKSDQALYRAKNAGRNCIISERE